jgi:signal transduction histidine kinase
MRAIAAGLRLPELEPLSPREVAQRAVDDHQRRSGNPVELRFDEPPGSPPDQLDLPVKITLFRALQELLSNATRHGGGRGIGVRLGVARGPALSGRVLRLQVSDQGRGFNVDQLDDPTTTSMSITGAAISGGLGLAGVREAAELLGGGFEITSAVGAGTRVDVWWPIGPTYLPGHPLAPGAWTGASA